MCKKRISLLVLVFRSFSSLPILFFFLGPFSLCGQSGKTEAFVHNNQNLEDATNKLTITNITAQEIDRRFEPALEGKNTLIDHPSSTYWIKFKISNPLDEQLVLTAHFLFDDVALFIPLGKNRFQEKKLGPRYPFWSQEIHSLNPTFIIPEARLPDAYYYIKLKSKIKLGLSFEIIPLKNYFNQSIPQYFLYGIFFGIVVIIGFYNLILFLIVKEKAYIFYGIYILSFCIFSLVNWGFLKLLFSNIPFTWQYYYWTIPFCSMTVFLMLYSKSFLETKNTLPFLDLLISWGVYLRIFILIVSLIFDKEIFYQPTIDICFLTILFLAGILRFRQGYSPAGYYLFGFVIIFIGYLIHTFHAIRVLPFNLLSLLSLNNTGIVELFFFSLALADRYRMLKKDRESSRQKVIDQLKENELLKDKVNRELEEKVAERTRDLKLANEKLEQQAQKIEEMNNLLREDNRTLESSVKRISRERVMQKGVTFQEFQQIYPDDEACFIYLDNLKWGKGFLCKKCGYGKFSRGTLIYSRKCSRCKYIETITASTLFSGVKFPIVKAFYIVFLHSWGKELTVDQLSEILVLRRNTCWAFNKRVSEVKKRFSAEKSTNILEQMILHTIKEEK